MWMKQKEHFKSGNKNTDGTNENTGNSTVAVHTQHPTQHQLGESVVLQENVFFLQKD